MGLRAIEFALERRGATVWSVPTVILPWHPGLGRSTRLVVDALPEQLTDLAAHAGTVDAILTGYFASAAQVRAAGRFIDAVRAVRPIVVIVDPVSGDEGGRYIPDDVAEAIVAELLPRADVATPNINELRDLGGGATVEAARGLGPADVVVTSAVADATRVGAWLVSGASMRTITHPRLTEVARGTGDLFSGVLTSALLADPADKIGAVRTAAAATLGVIAGSGATALDLVGNQEAIARPDIAAIADVEAGV
ncbi:MAG: bifunctional hydroxymethylpyrimidine kinase/phosphomethylpyrimidine kinase [Pseudomonadota bacterium]